jgi:hypothetical protein
MPSAFPAAQQHEGIILSETGPLPQYYDHKNYYDKLMVVGNPAGLSANWLTAPSPEWHPRFGRGGEFPSFIGMLYRLSIVRGFQGFLLGDCLAELKRRPISEFRTGIIDHYMHLQALREFA